MKRRECATKSELLDALSVAMAEHARVVGPEGAKLPDLDREEAIEQARANYEKARFALREHRRLHWC